MRKKYYLLSIDNSGGNLSLTERASGTRYQMNRLAIKPWHRVTSINGDTIEGRLKREFKFL